MLQRDTIESPPVALSKLNDLEAALGDAIRGKPEVLRLSLICLLAKGHLLIEDVPGVGKTTLAQIIARMTKSDFIPFSAVLSGIREIKEIMAAAERGKRRGRRTILFVDEIHRFNKA